MKNFKFLLFTIYYLLFITIAGCNSSSNNTLAESKICPQCNMPLPKDNIHTAYIEESNYFDDIGCLILWSKANRIELDSCKVYVFSNDTKEYIDAKTAYYTINEKTPMNYGFSAYAKPKDKTINFKEMQLRMLRGEHLANPKIRKKILGY
jgi:nitrous oxide reductase accessory protein NosL